MYNTFKLIFGGGLVNEVSELIEKLMNGLEAAFEITAIQGLTTFLQSVAMALVIVYFCMNLIDHYSKDMLTFEKVMIAFTKIVFAITIITYTPQILNGLFDLGYTVYDLVADNAGNALSSSEGTKLTYFGFDEWPDEYAAPPATGVKLNGKDIDADTMKELVDKEIFKFDYKNIGVWIWGLVFSFVAVIIKGAVYLAVCSNAAQLIGRAMFTPIALANLFDEGSKAGGIMFLKKTLALLFSFGVIVGMLWATSYLQSYILTQSLTGVLGNKTNIGADELIKIMEDSSAMIICLMIQVAAATGAMKATSLANDILHVH